jgi:hypothetical protein
MAMPPFETSLIVPTMVSGFAPTLDRSGRKPGRDRREERARSTKISQQRWPGARPGTFDRPGEGFGATFEAHDVRSIPDAAVPDRQGRVAFLGRFPEALARAADLLKAK